MYCTVADLKTYLGITVATDDGLLGVLLLAAQAQIDGYCGRRFEAAADATKYMDARYDVSGRALYLPDECCVITTVTNGDGVVVSSSDYVTEPRNTTPYYALRLKESADVYWTWDTTPENAISVIGRWAYSLTAPADVAHACRRMAAYMYRQKDSQVFDVTASPDIGQITIPQGIPADVKQLLDRKYVRLA